MSTAISALQRNASAVVRRVAATGVPEEITDRGRVVAVLAPPPRATGLDRLREAGLTRPGNPSALREALAMVDSLPSVGLMDALLEQRDSAR